MKQKENKPSCMICGSDKLYYTYDCHTYEGRDGTWMACRPCDSAIYYGCTQCEWSYTHGLNPKNPREEKNRLNKPIWLEGDTPKSVPISKGSTYTMYKAYPGIIHSEDVPSDWWDDD